ncbi:MAG TPA: PucC family protein, partial [Ktedonobacterales bacterium]
PLGVVFGLGYGAYTSVDWALAVDALPVQANAGKDLGIWSAASTLPAILAPALGGAVIVLVDHFYNQTALGYQAIFALAAVFLALGAVCVSFIRNDQQAPIDPARVGARRHKRRPGLGWWLAAGSRDGQAHGFLRFWPIWERIYSAVYPTQAIPNAPHGLLHIHLARYRGQSITLPDGTQVRPGAPIAELHFDNQRMSAAARTSGAFQLIRMIAEDMGALAAWASEPGPVARSEALTGTTLIGRAAPRLGFTTRERPVTIKTRLDRFFMEGLMAIYNPDGLRRLRRGTTYTTYPKEVWMSRGELLRRYSPRAEQEGDAQSRP